MTQFEKAVLAVEGGTLHTPTVSTSEGNVDYFNYQLAVHHFNLKLMAKGLQFKGVKLKDLKAYYGLTGRSAVDCLKQYEIIMQNYKSRTLLN
jgi:hypothetical protein